MRGSTAFRTSCGLTSKVSHEIRAEKPSSFSLKALREGWGEKKCPIDELTRAAVCRVQRVIQPNVQIMT